MFLNILVLVFLNVKSKLEQTIVRSYKTDRSTTNLNNKFGIRKTKKIIVSEVIEAKLHYKN